jgi:4-alpha-glucanotransferase
VDATDGWGVTSGYVDATGRWQATPVATRTALRAAMGADPGEPAPPCEPALQVVRARSGAPLLRAGHLALEDGRTIQTGARLPPTVPPGYHRLQGPTGEIPLIVTPADCPPPPGRLWGWAAQVHAARSTRSWGIGDLADLRRLAAWAAGQGAGILSINPLTAVTPGLPQQASPYYPSSRRFRNPLYLRVEEIPGAREAAIELEPLARAGRALNEGRAIDRDRAYQVKERALSILWKRFPGDPGLDRYRREQGRPLQDFATFCALAEAHGGGWSRWPAAHRRPDGPAVAEFRAAHAARVDFHAWLQWLLDGQLARAARACPLVGDLPVGFDPGGADAWSWQDLLATGVSVGAPPDRYVRAGQDWGLPPFAPHRLRAAGYAPFIETIRAALRHAGGLRIDHVMGLFRLFWIPAGAPPAAGAYVRYPAADLLGLLALESRRAGAFVVGEDLGTVEEGVREALAGHGVLSYRCLWFETEPPARYPALSLAAVTTHDLPTVAGLWTGADVGAQKDLGLEPNEAALARVRRRLAALAHVDDTTPLPVVIERTHALLAGAASAVVTATLEDALAVVERPNMPGTTAAWPNWSLALPVPLETLETHPLPAAIAAALAARRPAPAGAGPRAPSLPGSPEEPPP